MITYTRKEPKPVPFSQIPKGKCFRSSANPTALFFRLEGDQYTVLASTNRADEVGSIRTSDNASWIGSLYVMDATVEASDQM